jgi:hypothetical protein
MIEGIACDCSTEASVVEIGSVRLGKDEYKNDKGAG